MLDKVKKIIKLYNSFGFEAYLVGGCVRDKIMNEVYKTNYVVNDYDLATNCPLDFTKHIFPKYISTGEDHGTLTIVFEGEQFEVTRYRKDVDTDGRRATIAFAETIQEDLARRDFTINAIAWNPVTDTCIDPFFGEEDIKAKVLKFVGNAKDRILEDHLRGFRYVRFGVKYGFKMSELNEVLKYTNSKVISTERIIQELQKCFKVANSVSKVNYISMLFAKLLGKPSLNEVFQNVLVNENLVFLAEDDIFKDKILVKYTEAFKMYKVYVNKPKLDMVAFLQTLHKKDLFELFYVICKGKGVNCNDVKNYRHSRTYLISDLNIDGNEVQALGYVKGNIGLQLQKVAKAVFDGTVKNEKAELIKFSFNKYIFDQNEYYRKENENE